MSEWVIVVKRQFRKFSAISWWDQVNIQWDDDDVRFVLDQHAELDLYSASSLKQQSAGKYFAPLGHIIPILSLAEKQQIQIVYSFVLPDRGSNPQYIALEASTLIIALPMRFPIFILLIFFSHQNFLVSFNILFENKN